MASKSAGTIAALFECADAGTCSAPYCRGLNSATPFLLRDGPIQNAGSRLVPHRPGVRDNARLGRRHSQRLGSSAPEAHVETTVPDRRVAQPRPVAPGVASAIHGDAGTIRIDLERLHLALDAVEAAGCLRV